MRMLGTAVQFVLGDHAPPFLVEHADAAGKAVEINGRVLGPGVAAVDIERGDASARHAAGTDHPHPAQPQRGMRAAGDDLKEANAVPTVEAPTEPLTWLGRNDGH